ncbi:MAG: ThuA domain-containing protein [Verrucomicrobiia bacterium]
MEKKKLMIFILVFSSILTHLPAQQPSSDTNKIYIMGTNLPPEDLEKIIAALPSAAQVKPLKPRRLLIFDLNVNYGGHRSAAYANVAFKLMGEKTGAYETVISHDKNIFKRESITQFDALFFNNNVGNLFEDRDLRENIVEFVYKGGGLLGVHGTSVAFTKWPGAIEDWEEFGIMLGARGANHRESTEPIVVKIEDPSNPLTSLFESNYFQYRDEFFRFHQVYSRERVRVLLSIDTNRTEYSQDKKYGNTVRPDNDYAIAWIRNYGKGRVFYSTIAHNPYVFYDPLILKFYLNAVQFALGDLKSSTIPSARLNSRNLAFEKLGWKVGIIGQSADSSIEEICQLARTNDLLFSGIAYGERIYNRSDTTFDINTSQKDTEQYRLMSDKYGVRMIICRLDSLPESEEKSRDLFEFLDKMGVETVVIPAFENVNNKLKEFCLKTGVNIALDFSNQIETKTVNSTIKRYGNIAIPFLTIDRNSFKTLNRRIESLSCSSIGLIIDDSIADNPSAIESLLNALFKKKLSETVIMIKYDSKNSDKFSKIILQIEKTAIKLSDRKDL